MTVAIQGGWGTGKTSVMNMLSKDLESEADVHVVHFNTWQYSQFDLGDQLATSLLLRIISGMPDTEESEPKKVRLFKIAQGLALASAQVAAPILSHAANTVIPGAGDSLRELASRVALREQELEVGPIEAIERLRNEFAQLVEVSGKRVLVFVDDLDRLEPERAVELMEAIKLFLDVPNCVFVLAIDFDVVKRGVMQKYGNGFSDRKARAFFEKIIQVPFQLPTHVYETRSLLEDGLARSNASERDLDACVELAKASIGTNPRATKRLVNTFALLRQVRGDESSRDMDVDAFASLCLQNAYPAVSDFLNEQSAFQGVGEFLPSVDDEESEDMSGDLPDNPHVTTDLEVQEWREEWGRATPFLKKLRSHFSREGGRGDVDEERFQAATRLTSVTSAGEGQRAEVSTSTTWNVTNELDEMLARLAGKTTDAGIAWGIEFREALGDRVLAVGQVNPIWTLRRTDRKANSRVAALHFGNRTMSLVLERFEGARDFGALNRIVEELRQGPGNDVDTGSLKVAVLPGRNGGSKVRLQWEVARPISATWAAHELINLLE